jgi:hypothetical protein
MALEAETREYLDGEWTPRTCLSYRVRIDGPDGDSILTCDSWNAAHAFTPEDVANYLLEQHGATKRLRDEISRRKDAETELLSMRLMVSAWNRCVREWTDGGACGFACLYCGGVMKDADEAKSHSATCPKHDAVIRLAARERDIERAVKVAISTLYFAYNNYQNALWRVVAELNPEAAELLENDEAAAYAKYCDALEKPEVTG